MKRTGNPFRSIFIQRGTLHPVWRAIFYVAAYFFCLSFLQIPLVFAWITIVLLQGQTPEQVITSIEKDFMSLTWMLPLAVLQAIIIVVVTYLVRRFVDRKSFRSLGFGTSPGWAFEFMIGLVLGFAVMACIFFAEWLAGWATIRLAAVSLSRVAIWLAGYGIIYIAVGLAEELMFRGYLLQTLREWPGTMPAVVITSVVFSLFHICNPNASPIALLYLMIAGFVFAYAYLSTGRLWLPIALHFSWNFFQGPVFGFPVSGVAAQSLFTVQSTGPAWITGGDFGPEGGLAGLVSLVAIAGVIGVMGRIKHNPAVRDGIPADH